jgi:hypothetical protein
MMDSQQFAFDHTVSRRGFLRTLGMAGGLMASWSAAAQPGPLGVSNSANSRLFTFIGGETGNWSITDTRRITGDPWTPARKLTVVNGPASDLAGAKWLLRGVTSNERYVTRADKDDLVNRQEGLGRPDALRAALIPIRKTAAWWALTQDERRAVFEEQSHHTTIGLKYLPAVARRLHHSRDLGTDEPFDFLTWFEFSKSNADAFDRLLADLRATKEWAYVERETEIRLVRD